MTTTADTPPETVPGALHFTAPTRDAENAPGTRVPFHIGDDPQVLWAIRPKQAILLSLAEQAEAINASGDQTQAMHVYRQLLTIFDPESKDYLVSRFTDPKHDWDLDMLQPVLTGLVEHWFAGPTGGQAASPGPSSRTGKRSTGRVRSKGSTQRT